MENVLKLKELELREADNKTLSDFLIEVCADNFCAAVEFNC